MKTSTIVAVLVVLIAIVAGWYWLGLPPMPPRGAADGGVVACTADAMQCPDGSWVGRTGPNCEFVCPTGAAPAPAQPALIQGSASSSVTTGTAEDDQGIGDASVPAQ